MLIHSAEITGSVQFNNTDVSGITNVSGFATTASVDALVVKTGSYASTSSVNELQSKTGSYASTSSVNDLQSKTGSYTSTSSFDAYSSSINTFTSSATTRLNTIESVTGSFASTSSVNNLQSVTGSYASTGSNQFNGNQSISGSIVSNGTITAQTLVVQTVTSSIEFVTGSTRNGSLSENTHQFTGSVLMSGSHTVNGGIVTTGASAGYSIFRRDTSVYAGGWYAPSSSILLDVSGLGTALAITSAGSVGINTSSPTTNVGLTVKRSTGTGWIIDALNSSNIRVGGFYSTGGSNGQLYLANSAGTETVILDSAGASYFSGSVGIGTTSPASGYRTHIVASGSTAFLGISNQGTATGDRTLRIGFGGNGADTHASIQGTRLSIADDVSLALQPGGGNVGIGTSSPTTLLHLSSTYNGGGTGQMHMTSNGTEGGTITFEKTSGTAQKYKFGLGTTSLFIYNETAGNQPFTLTSGGNVLIGTTTDGGYKLEVNGTMHVSNVFGANAKFSSYTTDGLFSANARPSYIITPSGVSRILLGYNDYGAGQYYGRIGFYGTTNWSLGHVGSAGDDFSIGVGFRGTAFYIYSNNNYSFAGSNVSDSRKKANINYITSNQLDTILKLKPASFNQKDLEGNINSNTHTGFIAQDVLESGIANLVHGSDEGGYGLDYNGVLALAVKAIQELKAEIDILKQQ